MRNAGREIGCQQLTHTIQYYGKANRNRNKTIRASVYHIVSKNILPIVAYGICKGRWRGREKRRTKAIRRVAPSHDPETKWSLFFRNKRTWNRGRFFFPPPPPPRVRACVRMYACGIFTKQLRALDLPPFKLLVNVFAIPRLFLLSLTAAKKIYRLSPPPDSLSYQFSLRRR